MAALDQHLRVRRNQPYIKWARRNRREENGAEDRMWSLLRAHRLEGHKFRRQHQIGNYIVDFVCLQSKLIVEVDGETHGNDIAELNDARRQSWLEQQGYAVIRFDNDYVYNESEGVWDEISRALRRQALRLPAVSMPPPPRAGD